MELGSDFELNISDMEQTEDNIFRFLEVYNCLYMDSGRSAAAVLNTIIKEGIVLLPLYICESVINVYKERFAIRFYKIQKDLKADIRDFEKKVDEDIAVVYIMHYFGQLQDKMFLECVDACRKKYGFTIVEDTTHSIFTESKTIGDFCICSLRKWFPIMDGGVLYTNKELEGISGQNILCKTPSNKLYAMILKHLYIAGVMDSNQLYRNIFVDEENKLEAQKEIYQISYLSKCLLSCFSISEMREKRQSNYKELKDGLLELGIELVLTEEDFVPLCCPIYVENRDEFRNYLIDNQVYCAVHWPLKDAELKQDETTMQISQNIISLPIDQRYGRKQMLYLINTLKNYFAIH